MTAAPGRSIRWWGRWRRCRRWPLSVAFCWDCKLISYTNVKAFFDAEVSFIAPASKEYVPAELLAAQDPDAAIPVDYVAERDADKAAEERGSYRVVEDGMVLAGKTQSRSRLEGAPGFRVVLGSGRRGRSRQDQETRDDLERLERGLGSRHYPDADTVAARVAQIGRDRRVRAYLGTQIGSDQEGKPTLQWSLTRPLSTPRRPPAAGMRS
jgi:hypothetical protein